MINCILINNDENDNVMEIKVKNLTEETIYKKCNFKNTKDFNKIKEWNVDNNNIELWGKINGNKNLKNNWDFFNKENLNIYGKSIFIMKDVDNSYISLSKEYLFSKILFLKENNKSENDNNKTNIINTINTTNNIDNDIIIEDDNESIISNYSYNSELSYELYSYSDDEAS